MKINQCEKNPHSVIQRLTEVHVESNSHDPLVSATPTRKNVFEIVDEIRFLRVRT